VNPYPLGLQLDGLRVLVVGGGAVATRRVPALLDAGADVVLVSPHVTPARPSQQGGDPMHVRILDLDGALAPQTLDVVGRVLLGLDTQGLL